MYHPTYHHTLPVTPVASLRPEACNLSIRQQPKEALITTDGKEKARKPIDPPPILELNVLSNIDPHQQYLQSPYLFACVSLWKADKDEPYDASGEKSLTGSLVSSLHRLKDVNNKDGGFFIFGDISVKVQGTFRLRFSLYEFQNLGNEVVCLGSCNSDKFKVLLPKDFKGMEESTYLSRAFSDQGVRLRLRKEPRGMCGTKRTHQAVGESLYSPEEASPSKRIRAEVDTVPVPAYSYPTPTAYTSTAYQPNTSNVFAPNPTPTYASNATNYTPNTSTNYAANLSMYTNTNTLSYTGAYNPMYANANYEPRFQF